MPTSTGAASWGSAPDRGPTRAPRCSSPMRRGRRTWAWSATSTAPTAMQPWSSSHYPDVVVDGQPPADQARVTAGRAARASSATTPTRLPCRRCSRRRVPVVLDAGALSVVAGSAAVRATIVDRAAARPAHRPDVPRGRVRAASAGRARRASAGSRPPAPPRRRSSATIVLKGPGTVIVDPEGVGFIDTEGTADLGTAGSGDVLTGVVAAVLAPHGRTAAAMRPRSPRRRLPRSGCTAVPGREAAVAAPVTATDIADAVPAAIRAARFGDDA